MVMIIIHYDMVLIMKFFFLKELAWWVRGGVTWKS